MIRVAMFIPTIVESAGGTSTALLSTLAAMRTRPDALDFTVFTSRMPDGDGAWRAVEADGGEAGGRWRLSDGWKRGVLPGDLARVMREGLASGGYDLVHIHGIWASDLLAGARAARSAGVPIVWQPHGMLVRRAYMLKPVKKQAFMALGLRSALRSGSGFVFVTADERDTSVIPSGVAREKLHVVPLPVEFPESLPDRATLRERGRKRFGLGADDEVIVFLGRLHEVKRLPLAMEALAELARSRPRAKLLLLGSGDEGAVAQLKALAERLGILKRVVFAGWVSGDAKWEGLAAGDVLTLHSMFENFGYVLVEALGVGTRVVLTENLALASEVRAAAPEHGGVGIVVGQTARELAAGYARALESAEDAPMWRAGRAWAREAFSKGAIAERLIGVYSKILGRTPLSPPTPEGRSAPEHRAASRGAHA